MATATPTSHRSGTARPVTRTVSILSKKKSLWKMVRSLLLPTRLVSTFASCGGGGYAAKRKRRLERVRRNGGQAPMERKPRVATEMAITGSANIESATPLASVTEVLGEMSLAEDAETTPIANPISGPEECEIVQIHPIQVVEVEVEIMANLEEVQLEGQNLEASTEPSTQPETEEIVVRRRDKMENNENGLSSVEAAEFHGWRKSSIDVNTEPPLTLKWIPSGLQIGDQVLWLAEEEPPEKGVVRWIGKIRQQFYAGVEFERSIGNSSGLYGYGGGLVARLFTCDLGMGRFTPIDELVLYSDFHDKGIKAGFICIICRDDFLELPDAQGEEGHMVATKCGHLYHETCLHGWFAAKNKGKPGEANKGQPCPHCQGPITLDDMIRLFPAQV